MDNDKKTKKIKLRKYVSDSLFKKYKIGCGLPKHTRKNEHNSTPYIHSIDTYKTYKKQVKYFIDWCYEHNIKTPEEAIKNAPLYLKELEEQGLSAWTISTRLSAIAKAWGISTLDIPYTAPQRKRANVKRSRFAAERDKHVSPLENKDIITFCRCTGLRKNKELAKVQRSDVTVTPSGSYIDIKGKGGKPRKVPIITKDNEEITIINRILNKEGLLFPHIPTNLDVHSLRSEYACRIYTKYARPINDVPANERYTCRRDMKGKVFDKKALRITSKTLGHSREEVVVNNYLWKLK